MNASAEQHGPPFVRIGTLTELQPGRTTAVLFGERSILLSIVDGQVYAVDDLCSHMRRRIGEGRLSGHWITCPHHSANFDVRSGCPKGFPATKPIRTFPVRIIGGEIWAAIDSLPPRQV